VLLFEKPILYTKDDKGKKIPDWWDSGKKGVLSMGNLLGNCKDFKKDDIKPELVETLKPIIESPEYDDSVLSNASKAAWGLGKWVRAMV
jgi:dynein heavy chain